MYVETLRSVVTYRVTVAPPTQGTWRSNDYVSAVRLVDACSMEWVGELIIYIWSDWHEHA